MLPKSNTATLSRRSLQSEPSLLGLALTGFFAVSGCGDDWSETSSHSPSADSDASATDAGPNTPTAGDASATIDASTESVSSSGLTSRSPEAASSSAASSGSVAVTSDDGASTGASSDAGVSSDIGATLAGPDGGSVDVDVDRDGVSLGDGDCNDFNDAIFPGAPELALDGVDSDCDGGDSPAMTLVWSSTPDADQVDALALLDMDHDGTISLAEFNEHCGHSAKLVGQSRPGLLQYHAACAGTNSCRGMVLQTWGELYEHSCRGVNFCAGWSCVETAADAGRSGEVAFDDAHCRNCHGAEDGSFEVFVPPDTDAETYLAGFWETRSDDYLRSIIGFGVSYTTAGGYRMANMPGAHSLLARAEIDRLIVYLRGLPLTPYPLDLPGHIDHNGMPDAGSMTNDSMTGASATDATSSGPNTN